MVKAIIFDFFKTLAEWPGPDPEDDLITGFKLGLSYDEVERALQGTRMRDYGGNLETYRTNVLTSLGLEVTSDNEKKLEKILANAAERTSIHPDAQEVVQKSIEKGYKIGLITNAWPHPITKFVYSTDFGKMFDVIIASYEVGLIKPDPEIYLLALKEINIEPEEAAMVGDSLRSDIKGAKAVGMKTVLYDPEKKHQEKPPEADYIIQDLKEIPPLFI